MKKFKKILRKIHLYLALAFFLPLLIQGVTGSILVLEKPIEEFLLKKNYQFAEGRKAPLIDIIDSAQKSVSPEFILSFVRISREEQNPAFVRFANPNEKREFIEVIIDPVTLQTVKINHSDGQDFFSFITRLHANFLIQGDLGRNIIGIFGSVFLFMALSGIILWWPKMAGLKQAITFKLNHKKSEKGKLIFHKTMHNSVGFWAFTLILIISFSGIYFAFPKAISKSILAFSSGEDVRWAMKSMKANPAEKKAAENFPVTIAKIEEVLKLTASEIDEEDHLVSVRFPTKTDQLYRFNFVEENQYEDAPAKVLLVDHGTKKIVRKFDPEFYSPAEKTIVWLPLLHEGLGLGIIWKTLVIITGMLPILFAITGIKMWMMKKRNG
jgi:uncharacterized iron-regulated membrane protein